MKFYLSMIFLFLPVVFFVFPKPAHAAEEDADNLKYTFGTVAKISADQVVIMEYNDQSEKEEEVTYKVNAKTQFKNTNALQELIEGDSIEIFYQESKEGKTASQIIKEVAFEDLDIEENADEPMNVEENLEEPMVEEPSMMEENTAEPMMTNQMNMMPEMTNQMNMPVNP